MLVSKGCSVKNFVVLDPDVNFSDHLPLLAEFSMSLSSKCMSNVSSERSSNTLKSQQVQLRWDKACSDSYYYYTGQHLESLGEVINCLKTAHETGSTPVTIVFVIL